MTGGRAERRKLAILEYFGTQPTPMSFPEWIRYIDRGIHSRSNPKDTEQAPLYCAHHNLNSLYHLRHDEGVATFYRQASSCYIDGVGALLPLRLAGFPAASARRFTLMDHFEDLLAEAQRRGWRLAYVGSRPEVIEQAKQRLRREYPRLQCYLQHGYVRDDAKLLADLNEFGADLLLVGMGMPQQECWLSAQRPRLRVRVACQAGATMDYYAGAQSRPPILLSRIGLAWLFRLLHDPRRLWRRYLWEPWGLLIPSARLFVRARRGSDAVPGR